MRFLLIPVVVAVLLLGIWVTGGLITDDFKLSMALTAAWMAVAGIAIALLALKRTRLRVPLVTAYLLTAIVAGGYLASETFIDDVVDEQVATAAAPAQADPQRPRNVRLGRGAFESVAHGASGVATTIDLARGGRVLTLTDFEVSNGPDLRVYLVAGAARDENEVDDFIDLGGLKGNRGNQQYDIPADADLDKYGTVVIWCRAFSVLFARAPVA